MGCGVNKVLSSFPEDLPGKLWQAVTCYMVNTRHRVIEGQVIYSRPALICSKSFVQSSVSWEPDCLDLGQRSIDLLFMEPAWPALSGLYGSLPGSL